MRSSKIDGKAQLNLENTILGVFVIHCEWIADYLGVLTEDDFINPLNKQLWTFMANQTEDGRPVDMVIIEKEMVMDIDTLSGYVEKVENSAHLPEYIKLIKENTCRREIEKICRIGGKPDIMGEQIFDIVSKIKTQDIAEYSIDELAKITHDIAMNNKGTEFKFNLPALQRKTAGFDRHESLVIAGHTSHGKSALATHLSMGFAVDGLRLLYLTAEQSEIEMTRNILANMCHIDTKDFRTGRYSDSDKQKVLDAEVKMRDWNFMIRRITNTADIHKAVKKNSPDIVVIDYLQNLAPIKVGMSQLEKDSTNMGVIQNLTIREPIATITLSQLSRPKKGDKPHRPTIHDFKNSGDIENKASIALLIWWQNRADGKGDRKDKTMPEHWEIDICKAKSGDTGVVLFDYYPENCRFENWTNPSTDVQEFTGSQQSVEGFERFTKR